MTMLISPLQFALTGGFLAGKHFLIFWICQPIPYFHKFSFGDVITCLLCKARQLGYDKYYNDNSHNHETMFRLSGPRTAK